MSRACSMIVPFVRRVGIGVTSALGCWLAFEPNWTCQGFQDAAERMPASSGSTRGAGEASQGSDDRAIELDIDRIRASSSAGLAWLVDRQQPDGSWGSGRFESSAAVTAAAGLALVASGSTPASGPHAKAVRRCVERLLASADDDGVFQTSEPGSTGPMYGHAFAVLLLAEVSGETEGNRVRLALRKAVLAIEAAQSRAGGWRYGTRPRVGRSADVSTPSTNGQSDDTPRFDSVDPGDADASVTAAVMTALAAAARAGVPVSRDTIGQGRRYLLSLQNADGGFRYQSTDGPSAAPRTAAVLVALALTKTNDSDDGPLDRGYAWLEANPVPFTPRDSYTLYGMSAATSAWWQRGGEAWRAWYGAAAANLLATQSAEGAWKDASCDEYGTAAALSTLLAPDGLLPVLQP